MRAAATRPSLAAVRAGECGICIIYNILHESQRLDFSHHTLGAIESTETE